MTDTTTSTTTAAPATSAADTSASAQSTQNSTNAPGQAAGLTEPSSSTPAPDQAAAPKDGGADKKDSGKTDTPARGDQAKPDAGKPDDGKQPSDDQKTDDSKKDDEGKDKKEEGNQEAQPQQYQPFTMPEGMEMDNDALNEALPVLQGLKASQEDAQKLVNVASAMMSKVMKNVSEQHNKVVEGWRKETEGLFAKDGDAKFNERVGRAEEVVKQFFNEEQRNVLTAYGLGNHPAFFAMCLAIAEGTSEDRPNLPASTGGLQSTSTLANTWYPEKS